MSDDDRARITARMPQDVYDQLTTELSAFSTDTARFQFLVQFYLDYKDMQCRCMPQAHPPAEFRPPRSPAREEGTSPRQETRSSAGADSADAAGENTLESTDDHSPADEGGEQESGTSQP